MAKTNFYIFIEFFEPTFYCKQYLFWKQWCNSVRMSLSFEERNTCLMFCSWILLILDVIRCYYWIKELRVVILMFYKIRVFLASLYVSFNVVINYWRSSKGIANDSFRMYGDPVRRLCALAVITRPSVYKYQVP